MFKQFFSNKKGIIFDLDGTLINSFPIWNKAFSSVYSSFGYEWRGANFIGGDGVVNTWKEYLDYEDVNLGVSWDELRSQTNKAFLKNFSRESVEVVDGFWRLSLVLKEQEDRKLGMVTNTDKEVGEKVVEILGLKNSFDLIIYGDDVKKKKPDPAIYKLWLEKTGLKGKDVLVFEDSPDGAKAAVDAGIDVIVVWDWRKFNKKEYPAQVLEYVADLSVIPPNLDKTREEAYQEILNPASDEE